MMKNLLNINHTKLILSLIIVILAIYIENKININLIKIGFFCLKIKNGGIERVISLIINLISKEKSFRIYLITKKNKLKGEFPIPDQIKRIYLYEQSLSLFEIINQYQLDILIYNFYNFTEIKLLNKLKNVKVIYYDHASVFHWIYLNLTRFNRTIYYQYKFCKYVISLVPFENDYLFKKWGINSILMDNPITFDYYSVVPSDLKRKNIILIGRGDDKLKRFNIVIYAMKIITKYVKKAKLNIISFRQNNLLLLIQNLSLTKNIRFVGYKKNINYYLKTSCLHILPSSSESYSMVLSETKIFGIPSIVIGLDYIALSKKGTIIIYDDNPLSIAKEAIKILKDYDYRKKLGSEARESIKNHKNSNVAKDWIKLLRSIYKGKPLSSIKLSYPKSRVTEIEAKTILSNQLKLIKKRKPNLKNLTLEKLINFSLI